MLDNKDYKSILETISSPILVASPIYNKEGIIYDFEMEFVNDAFKSFLGTLVQNADHFSDFSEKLTPEVSWTDMAYNTIKTHQPEYKTFYSLICNKWLKAGMNTVDGKFILITLTDITKDKESEQQLMRQNLRLASLTDELSLSRSSLRTKLDSIQTLNQQLLFAAYHDTMTNLSNRASFNKSVQTVEDECQKNSKKYSIILLNIDNMRDINESRGHHEGDSLIRHCATILRKFEGGNVTPFRFGGDEFIILHSDIDDRKETENLSQKIHNTFNDANIGISGGIALYPEDSTSYEDLLKFADMAKTEGKKNGKNQIFFFHQVMQEKFLAKLNIETKLSKAMA